MNYTDCDAFTQGYITAALWSSHDESDPETGGEPMDANYGPEDIVPDTLAEMVADCKDFQLYNAADLLATEAEDFRNGVDFWLTRNHHGAGFWDRGYGGVGERLTAASHVYGEVDLYVGNDEMIHA